MFLISVTLVALNMCKELYIKQNIFNIFQKAVYKSFLFKIITALFIKVLVSA